MPVSPWVRVTHSGEFGQDLELLSARQALTLQGAQQVVAILRGKKLQLGNRLENLMEHLWKSHGTHGIFMEHLWKSDGTRGTSMEHLWNIYGKPQNSWFIIIFPMFDGYFFKLYISIFREARMVN